MRNSCIFGTWYKQKLTQVLARLWLHDLHILCWLYKYTRRNFKTYLLDLLKNSVFSLLKKGKEARRTNTTRNISDFQGNNDVPWTLNSWKTCCLNGRFNSLRGCLFAELGFRVRNGVTNWKLVTGYRFPIWNPLCICAPETNLQVYSV